MAFVQAVVQAYAQRGLAAEPALQVAQIAPAQLLDPQARITALQMELLCDHAMRELDDEGLGWFSRRLPWGSYGMLARASISSPSLGLAMARWCRHHGLLTEDITLSLQVDGPLATIRLQHQRDLGELEQRERDEVLVQFANGSCSVLVATDVAARGLDIANLACVINVDVTPDSEVHIHRIGRTGRGDAEGLALNLVAMDEMPHVAKIEQLQERPSEWFEVSELTPAPGGALLPPMMTIQIIGGRKEKIRAGDVMGAMCADFGYAKEQIGKISVNDFSTYVAVDRRIAAQACAKLNNGRVKGKSVRARVL